jgi:hypothetical protein
MSIRITSAFCAQTMPISFAGPGNHAPNAMPAISAIRIQVVSERRPELPQVACFDTGFHRGHGPLADHFAIPEELYAEGVRRYGFHGLSYEYIASALPGNVVFRPPSLAFGEAQ